MSYGYVSSSIRSVERQRRYRPFGVMLTAGFQAMKGGVLVFTGLALHFRPELVSASVSVVYPLLYLALRGNSAVIDAASRGDERLVGVIVVLGIYLATIGIGLWEMKQWARRSMVVTSGLMLLLCAKVILSSSAGAFGTPPPGMVKVDVLFLIDALIFIYLMRGNTGRYFEAKG